MKNLAHLKAIADHFRVDESVPVGIVLGEMGTEEAVNEMVGYVDYKLDKVKTGTLKKAFFSEPDRWGSPNLEKEFSEVFEIKTEGVKEFCQGVLAQAGITKTPVDVGAVLSVFPDVTLQHSPDLGTYMSVALTPGSKYKGSSADSNKRKGATKSSSTSPSAVIGYVGDLESPYLRFNILKYLFLHLYQSSSKALGNLLAILTKR